MLQSASLRNPPCGICKIAACVRTWNCAGPGAASPKLPMGAFCAVIRADSESAHEGGLRGSL
eukprot:12869825-Alexandrium_andersonii.AAC.1